MSRVPGDNKPAKSELFRSEEEPEEAEVEVETPREGTLAWVELQPHVELHGELLPEGHRIPEDASLTEERSGKCRVIRASGERCGAVATRAYGICLAHLGGGGFPKDEEARKTWSAKANRKKLQIRQRRELLGIGPRRAASPRQIARVQALERAQDLADALLAPLDDDELGSLARQRAAVTVLDATFPLATVSAEVELPADEGEVAALGWGEMQRLAAQLLDTNVAPALSEASGDAG